MTGLVVIEGEVLSNIMGELAASRELFERAEKLITTSAMEDERSLTFEDAMMFLGVKRAWLSDRQHEIGFWQDGKEIKFTIKNLKAFRDSKTNKTK